MTVGSIKGICWLASPCNFYRVKIIADSKSTEISQRNTDRYDTLTSFLQVSKEIGVCGKYQPRLLANRFGITL